MFVQGIFAEIAASLAGLPLAHAGHLLLWAGGWRDSSFRISPASMKEIYRSLHDLGQETRQRRDNLALATLRRLTGDPSPLDDSLMLRFRLAASGPLEQRRSLAEELFRPLHLEPSQAADFDPTPRTHPPLPLDKGLGIPGTRDYRHYDKYHYIAEGLAHTQPGALEPWSDSYLRTAIFLAHLPTENRDQILCKISSSGADELRSRMGAKGPMWDSLAFCMYAFVETMSFLMCVSAVSFEEAMRMTHEPITPADPPPWHGQLREEHDLPGWHQVAQSLSHDLGLLPARPRDGRISLS